MNSIAAGLLPIFLEYLLPVIGTIIGLGVTWLLARLEQKFGLEVEAKHREALQEALTNAAGLLFQRITEDTKPRINGSPAPGMDDPTIDEAIDYVRRSVPDALRFFDISAESIAQKVLAKLGRI